MILAGILYIFWTTGKANSQALSEWHTCVTDYWHTISCSVKLAVPSSRYTNTSYQLEFYWVDETINFTCTLQRADEVHRCSIQTDSYNSFMDLSSFIVTLHYSKNRQNLYPLESPFKPAKNIKPNVPYNLTLQYSNGTYVFNWTNGYEDHEYKISIQEALVYNFLYFKEGHRGSEPHSYLEKEIRIDETNLHSDCKYIAMVRTGMPATVKYNGTWSEWSVPVEWRTKHRDKLNQADVYPGKIAKIALGICLILGLLILLLFAPAARMKIKEIVWVPTPETYFQPLYTHYQGNFQFWVLPKCPLQDVHVMEEFAAIDKIAEPITKLQDQEEKSDMCPPAQFHTTYVGPTTELWAPCQMSKTCSETSIPCEDFSLFCDAFPDKVDNLFQCLTTVRLCEDDNFSLKDSVLSLKSLESLENREVSEAPIIFNPTPVWFKQDYCTLTETPAGPVPTFTKDVELDGNTSNTETHTQ
ncbi:interleukin 21 receptor, tandem duplicate 2 [Misgurnus anguillicaudatus]|uniref:interleukin 21 receptor, tandem duplicate 2 n=1 Tax=Misgurnus anguillicaudatus TaxID=75329 RepID=UPI003CCF0F53